MTKEVYNKGLSLESLGKGTGKGIVKATIDYGASKIPGVDGPDQLKFGKGYGNMNIGGITKKVFSDNKHVVVTNLQSRVTNATIDAVKGKVGAETTNLLNGAAFGK